MNAYFRSTIDGMLQSDPNTIFTSANAIWIDKSFPVLQTFKDVNTETFDAEIQNVVFADATATAKLISDWCNLKTRGMIPEIVNEDNIRNALMCLGNALYFKGAWTLPFPKEDTKDEVFHNLNGSLPQLPAMQLEAQLNYEDKGDFKILELPYGNESFFHAGFTSFGRGNGR